MFLGDKIHHTTNAMQQSTDISGNGMVSKKVFQRFEDPIKINCLKCCK